MTDGDSGSGDALDSDLYFTPTEETPNLTVRSPDREFDPEDSDNPKRMEELNELLEEATEVVAEQFDDVADVLTSPLVDAMPDDDLKPNSKYDLKPMVAAWMYRLVVPSEGYSLVSWEQLANRLDDDPDLAETLGFDPDQTPSERTLRTQWWTRVRQSYRVYVRYMAAEKALKAERYGLETAENIRENLIADFEREDGEPEHDPIGELEQDIKDRAYDIQADMLRDLCTYDRDDSTEWDSDLITDTGSHMCRRNEFAEQGIERMGKEYGLIEEHEDGSQDWNVFTPQTFRRTVRNVERYKVDGASHSDEDKEDDDDYGADWVLPHELVDEAVVRGDLREALEEEWAINPHNPEGETSVWHRRTEEGIERQIQWLKDEDVIDEDDSFRLRIDYTTHNYSRHSSTESIPPIGVHKQSHLDTGYAYKELQATIKINGRAFVIASVNYLPTNKQFQCVRYLIDRAQELVNIDTVLGDAEFCTVALARYAAHRGCDYVFRKGATDSVKETIEVDISGEADWVDDWTMITEGRFDDIDTTLVAVEKNFKSGGDSDDDDDGDEDDEPDTTLDDFNGEDDEEPGVQGQLTLEQAIDEPHKDSEDIDYFTMITNRSVKGPGINPDDNPIAHDPSETAWGIGRIYRDRWSVETAFRDRKETFQAQTTSRDLGYRRFLWMMANLLYNGWVLLNTAVADQSPDRDDDEIVVKQATYLDELDRRVLSEIPGMEFPGLDYG